MPIRPRRDIYAFGHELLVACPQCSRQASLTKRISVKTPDLSLQCSHCGLWQSWLEPHHELRLGWPLKWIDDGAGHKMLTPSPFWANGNNVRIWVETSPDITLQSMGEQFDLWLQADFEAYRLWFLNLKHLDFVADTIRQSPPAAANSQTAPKSRSKSHWLLNWTLDVSQKAPILSTIAELRLKAQGDVR